MVRVKQIRLSKFKQFLAKPAGLATLFAVVTLLCVGIGLVRTQHAHADIYQMAPQYIIDDINAHCNPNGQYRWGVVEDEWLSPAGRPTATSETVPYNTNSVDLQFNWISYRCHLSSPSAIYGSFIIDGTNPYIPTLDTNPPFVRDIPYSGAANDPYSGNYGSFPYAGSFTSSRDITISTTGRGTLTQTDGIYCAVVDNEYQNRTSSSHDFGPCRQGTNYFSLHIDVGPAPPKGNIDTSSCANPSATGWAYDPNRPSAEINVDAYVVDSSGPAMPGFGSPGGNGKFVNSFNTGVPRPDVNAAFGIPGNHGFAIDLTSYDGIKPRTFYLYAISAPRVPGGTNAYIGQVTIGPCAQPTCSNPTISVPGEGGSTPQPGQAFTVTGTATWTPYGADGTGSPGDITISGPGIVSVQRPPDSAGGGNLNETEIASAQVASAGSYTYTETINGQNCSTPPFDVNNKPYVKVYGGDTVSGSVYPDSTGSCTPNNAGTYAWYDPNHKSGASTDQGSFAVALVDGYASANGNKAGGDSTIGAPKSLSFANDGTPPVSPPDYGGNYGTAPGGCMPDYYSKLSKSPYATQFSGDATISTYGGAGPIANRNVYLYSNNDNTPSNVTIMGNNVTAPLGSYNPNTLPLFYVVVKGNIYIDNNVTNLDGVYIAEPSSPTANDGKIYTCSTTSGTDTTPVPSSQLFTDCKQQLTVNGALIGKEVHFLRTNGTAAQGTPASSQNGCRSDTNYAEQICYSPQIWLANPYSSSGKLNSISSLPPVL